MHRLGDCAAMSDLVHLSVGGGRATLTLDSPANRNALSSRLLAQLSGRLADALADDAVRVVVLSHTGPVFCSGMDLRETRGAGAAEQPVSALPALLETLWTCPKPVVARLAGPARAGGIGLVACCDLAVAADTATFAFSEVRLGLVPELISVPVLPRVAPRAAQELFLTGEVFDAHRAVRIGLLTRAVPVAELDDEVERYAGLLALGAPRCAGRYQGPARRAGSGHPAGRPGRRRRAVRPAVRQRGGTGGHRSIRGQAPGPLGARRRLSARLGTVGDGPSGPGLRPCLPAPADPQTRHAAEVTRSRRRCRGRGSGTRPTRRVGVRDLTGPGRASRTRSTARVGTDELGARPRGAPRPQRRPVRPRAVRHRAHRHRERRSERPQAKYDLQWKAVLDTLAGKGVNERTLAALAAAQGSHADGASRFVVASHEHRRSARAGRHLAGHAAAPASRGRFPPAASAAAAGRPGHPGAARRGARRPHRRRRPGVLRQRARGRRAAGVRPLPRHPQGVGRRLVAAELPAAGGERLAGQRPPDRRQRGQARRGGRRPADRGRRGRPGGRPGPRAPAGAPD